MIYTNEDAVRLSREAEKILGDLQTLMGELIRQGRSVPNKRAQEYMLQGASRRVMVLHKSVENIFRLFPLSLGRPLKQEELADVQINLHAFMINLYGVWDNWAWAFVHRHGLMAEIGPRNNVGLFHKETQKFLPSILREYLVSKPITSWHTRYLKEYRHALAHRIPLYVPPGVYTHEEWEQYQQLEDEQFDCLKSKRWERFEEARVEQENIGRPCFEFLHSFSKEEGSSSIALHSQVLCDAMTVVEFGTKFLNFWHKLAYTPEPDKMGGWLKITSIFRTLFGKLTQCKRRLGGKRN